MLKESVHSSTIQHSSTLNYTVVQESFRTTLLGPSVSPYCFSQLVLARPWLLPQLLETCAFSLSCGRKGCLRSYQLQERNGSQHLLIASTEVTADAQGHAVLLLQGSVTHWHRPSVALCTCWFSFICLFTAEKNLNILKTYVPTLNL